MYFDRAWNWMRQRPSKGIAHGMPGDARADLGGDPGELVPGMSG
jgi:hypothetical protein